jgi:CheY-like chemotaxis protein
MGSFTPKSLPTSQATELRQEGPLSVDASNRLLPARTGGCGVDRAAEAARLGRQALTFLETGELSRAVVILRQLAERPIEEPQPGSHATTAAEALSDRSPTIFLAEDTHVFRLRLSAILRDAGYAVLIKPPALGMLEALQIAAQAPDLVILPVSGCRPDATEAIESLREDARLAAVPVLAFTTLDRSGLDLEALRNAGVRGLVDKSCIPEQIVFRVNQLLRAPRATRRYQRAPAFLSLDLFADGETTSEYASSIGLGGLCVTSSRSLEPNTDVRVRLALPPDHARAIEAHGRVIYSRYREGGAAPWEVGVFFYPLDETASHLVGQAVEHLLHAAG